MVALRTLRVHGVVQASLHDICKATLIAQITYASPYASPTWNRFLSVADRNRQQSIVTKAKRLGYLPANYDSFDQLCANADEKLFLTYYNPNHVLHQLLPSFCQMLWLQLPVTPS